MVTLKTFVVRTNRVVYKMFLVLWGYTRFYILSRFLSCSGQVRSECLTCTFRASCCSARLSGAQVEAFAGSTVRDMKKGGGSIGGPPALAGTREYEQSDRNR